jgi:hypothetical protein
MSLRLKVWIASASRSEQASEDGAPGLERALHSLRSWSQRSNTFFSSVTGADQHQDKKQILTQEEQDFVTSVEDALRDTSIDTNE